MSPKDNEIYIEHMLECIYRIEEYTEKGREYFLNSRLVQDAVVRNLQTLAESSQRLSSECKESFPLIPWREISGFRNILVHDYLGIDSMIVWSVVELELPRLRDALKKMSQ